MTQHGLRCDQCRMVVSSQHGRDFQACHCGRVFVDGGTRCPRAGFVSDGGPAFTPMVKVGDAWIEDTRGGQGNGD